MTHVNLARRKNATKRRSRRRRGLRAELVQRVEKEAVQDRESRITELFCRGVVSWSKEVPIIAKPEGNAEKRTVNLRLAYIAVNADAILKYVSQMSHARMQKVNFNF